MSLTDTPDDLVLPPTPSHYRPAAAWSSYITVANLTRRKSTALVLAEASPSQVDGRPTPPSHFETTLPTSTLSTALLNSDTEPSSQSDASSHKVVGLAKVLTRCDVVAYGISCTIGAGIFVSTGAGTLAAGPAVMVSFLLASLSCLMSAFAYCEFAARVPVSGSAYTFTYVCLGELAAWFIGWNLTLEYCISAAAVARAWASNLMLFMAQIGVPLPLWLNSIHFVGEEGNFMYSMSLLSTLICVLCTALLVLGVKESSRVNIVVTVVNVSIIMFVIIAGSFYITWDNYFAAIPDGDVFDATLQCQFTSETNKINEESGVSAVQMSLRFIQSTYNNINFSFPYPMFEIITQQEHNSTLQVIPSKVPLTGSYFAKGLNGVLTGAALIFFSYVGFDSVTTLAEEVKSPKMDLPFGILTTLAISTTLYLGASGVITGMVPWYCVNREAPLAQAFRSAGNSWATTLISACSVTGLSATCLASLFGQPRVFYRMAKDGLFFQSFASIHPRTQTPHWGTLFTGLVAGSIALFLSIDSLQNMISIGTLMAFTTVCAGVIVMRYQESGTSDGAAVLPFWKRSSLFWLSIYLILSVGLCVSLRYLDEISYSLPIFFAIFCVVCLVFMSRLPVNTANVDPSLFICPMVPWLPALGMLANIYLITSLDWESYMRIVIWTLIGLIIYFGYGIRHSRLGLSVNSGSFAMN